MALALMEQPGFFAIVLTDLLEADVGSNVSSIYFK